MVRPLVAVILFCSALCAAQEYYVTYKLHSKNLSFYNEKIQISKAMVPSKQRSYKTLSFTTTLDSVEEVLQKQRYKIIDLLLTQSASVSAKNDAYNYKGSSSTTLRIYPKRIKVAFNNGLVKIGLLK